MDIRCERCATEYEFDDSRVTEEGVTVKCSSCGHLFKVRKKSFVLTEPVPQDGLPGDDDMERNWMVRRPDGSVMTFKELTTLQKWIVERLVTRDDEISKSGETWKRLGSIAELASFFQVVDQASQTSMPAVTQPPPPAVPVEPAPQASVPPPSQPEMTAAAPIMPPATQSSQVPVAAAPVSQVPQEPAPVSLPPAADPTGQVSAPPPSQPQMPVAPAEPVIQAPLEQASVPPQPSMPPPSQPSMPAQAPMGAAEPDTWGSDSGVMDPKGDDVVEKWKKRGRRKWFFIVPLILIVAGVGAFYLLAPQKFMDLYRQVLGESKPALPALAQTQFKTGYQHFMLDSQVELGAAIKDLNSAVGEAKGKYPQAMGVLAEALITRAERSGEKLAAMLGAIKAIDEQLAPLEPKDKKPDPANSEKIVALKAQKVELVKVAAPLQKQAQKDMEEAKRQIDAAREADPKALAPKRALANYLRVQGADRAQLEVPLKDALGIAPNDPALAFIDGASFASDPAALDTAAQKLNRAIELQAKAGQPDLLRARYALAKVLVAQKRPDEAKVQLERVLKVSPGHEAGKALLASLTAPPPEEPKEGDQPKEGDKPKEGDQPKEGDKPKGGDNPPPKALGYDGLMSQADRLQRAGRSGPALKAYRAALEQKPGDVEAETGQGLCLLDMGNNSGAVASFRRALKANSRYGDAIIGLAEAYKYKHDNENAIKYYKRYLEVLPSGPEASVARSNLEQLK